MWTELMVHGNGAIKKNIKSFTNKGHKNKSRNESGGKKNAK